MTRGIGGQSPANVQNFLKGASYPASREDLVQCAGNNGAPAEVMEILKRLPRDNFGGPQDVMKAYSEEAR